MQNDTYILSASERLLHFEPTDGRVSCVVDRWKLFPSSLCILFASGKVISQTADRTIVEYEVGSHQSVVSIMSDEVVEFRAQTVAEIERLIECLVVCRKVVQRVGVTGTINSSQVVGIYPDGLATRRSRGDVENQILLLETLCLSLQRALRGEDSSIRVALGDRPRFVRWGIENSRVEKVGIRIVLPPKTADPSIPQKIDVLPKPPATKETAAEVKVPKETAPHKPRPNDKQKIEPVPEVEKGFIEEDLTPDMEGSGIDTTYIEIAEPGSVDVLILDSALDPAPYTYLRDEGIEIGAIDDGDGGDGVDQPPKEPTRLEGVSGLEWLNCCLGAVLALIFITIVVFVLYWLMPPEEVVPSSENSGVHQQPSGGTSDATSRNVDPKNQATLPIIVVPPGPGGGAVIAPPTPAVVGPSNPQLVSPVSPPATRNPQTATPPSGPTAPATSPRVGSSPPDQDWKQNLVASKKSSLVLITTHDGSGSGFFISADGLVVTNAHVVGTERHVKVFLDGLSAEYKGEVKKKLGDGDGNGIDLALIQVLDKRGAPLRRRDFLKRGIPQIGQDVIALGFPWSPGDQEGTESLLTMTEGSLSRQVMEHEIQHWDHSARLLPGNSGGPLIDRRGLVVGINVAYAMGGERLDDIPVFLAIDAKYIDQLIRP